MINKIDDSNYIIIPEGKIDSSNANTFELQVFSNISKDKHITIDASKLEYISSAGLRTILKIKKEYSSLKIINTSAEVYEIFEMTGFTMMIDIERAYRQVDISNCKIIGKGYYGTIYRIANDTIVKVYDKRVTLQNIIKERELAKKAFVLGIPTAIPLDIVKVNDCYGTTFELLDAKTLADMIINDPKNIDKYIDSYVSVMKTIHNSNLNPGELVNKKQEVISWFNDIRNQFDEKTATKLEKLLNNLKDDSHVIHGDFHIKNLMYQNNEAFIIDMDTLAQGTKLFEYAFMYSCYYAYGEIDKINSLSFFGISQNTCEYIFNKSIKLANPELSDAQIKDLVDKARVISYIQLINRFLITKDHDKEIVLFNKEISELVNKIDDLNID